MLFELQYDKWLRQFSFSIFDIAYKESERALFSIFTTPGKTYLDVFFIHIRTYDWFRKNNY